MLEQTTRRPDVAVLVATLALVLAGALLTGGFHAVLRASADRATADGASVLAQQALRGFAGAASYDGLAAIEPGRDSLVTRVWLVDGDRFRGGYAVRVARLDEAAFTVRATGRLQGTGRPVLCAVDEVWRANGDAKLTRVSAAGAPICNGVRRSELALRDGPPAP
jgi:hypothetical protein